MPKSTFLGIRSALLPNPSLTLFQESVKREKKSSQWVPRQQGPKCATTLHTVGSLLAKHKLPKMSNKIRKL